MATAKTRRNGSRVVPSGRGGVGGAQRRGVLGGELGRVRRRPGSASTGRSTVLAHPGQHRVAAGEHVQVRRLPHVGGQAGGGRGRRSSRRAPGRRPVGARRRPAATAQRGERQRSASSACVGARKLPGTCTASQPPGASQPGPAGEQPLVAGHPVQDRVADDDVDRPLGRPVAHVAGGELDPARDGGRRGRGEHLGGGVDPGHRARRASARPGVAVMRALAAAQVDHGRRAPRRARGRAGRRRAGPVRRRSGGRRRDPSRAGRTGLQRSPGRT